MKQIISFSIICIIISTLFSSCGSNMSIVKRHYNNGYYISYNNIKKSEIKLKEEEKIVQAQTSKHLHSVKNETEQNAIAGNSHKGPIKDNNDVVASNEKMSGKTISQRGLMQELKQKIKTPESPSAQVKYALSEKNQRIGDTTDDDALSLMWIVIVVILILWLLGFLAGGFGLGGLINLLLLIALILLILWLLRVL